MDDPEAVGRRGGAKVSRVDQSYSESAQGGVPGDGGTVNAGANHEQVECRIEECREVASHAQASRCRELRRSKLFSTTSSMKGNDAQVRSRTR
jgi:hypothetical protein